MIMRNAVILVDQVRAEMAEGRDPWNAVVEAAVRRTRPVALTAAATVLAMLPLTRRSVFVGPDGDRHHGRSDCRYAPDDLFLCPRFTPRGSALRAQRDLPRRRSPRRSPTEFSKEKP